MIRAVVGLDLSLTGTGLVRFPLDDPHWDRVLIATRPSDGRVWERYEIILQEVRKFVGPDDVVFCEDYAFAANAARARLIAEMSGLVKFMVWKRTGYWPFEVPPTSLKKFATGRGNAKKSDIRVAVFKKTKLDFDDDNVADAYVLTQIGLLLLDQKPIPIRKDWLGYEYDVGTALNKRFRDNGRWRDLQVLANET